MRVCIHTSGKIVESQSGGSTPEHLQTLISNALSYGYLLNEIEAKFVSDAEYAQLVAAQPVDPEEQAETVRKAAIDQAIAVDATVSSLKAMSNAEFDTWWAANVTNAAQAINVLKRITRVVIRRVL